MITFKEFSQSIKEMACFLSENLSEGKATEKIAAFIKHVNVNCQYNYNVVPLIKEQNETPVKHRTDHSLSSSVCDPSNEETKGLSDFTQEEKAVKLFPIESKSKSHRPGKIDDNITKALNALKSPRLSLPYSNEQSSTPDSSQVPKTDEENTGNFSEEK